MSWPWWDGGEDGLWLRAAAGPRRGRADMAASYRGVAAWLFSPVSHAGGGGRTPSCTGGMEAGGWLQQGRGSPRGAEAAAGSHALAGGLLLFCSLSLGS